jgi:predicted nucleic acid-binding protein
VKLYLDTSVLVAILIRDLFTERAYRYLNTETPSLIVSGRRIRLGRRTQGSHA